jgi:hypothetical protein
MHVDDLASFESQLCELLELAAGDNESNRITVSDVREWTAKYVREHAEEIRRFPEIADESHWNLFARDDYGEQAIFVIVAFTTEYFGIFAGRDDFPLIRDFGENSDSDVGAMIQDAQESFTRLSEFLTIPVSHAYFWAESS